MEEKKKLPVGIDSFETIIKEKFYYVDKTGLIVDLLKNWGSVNLFTRPRRFGKSLNMDMLKSFFSPETDKSIFEGLTISKEKALCEEYRGKYPVISISLKDVSADTYEGAYQMAEQMVRGAAMDHQELLESNKLSTNEKQLFQNLWEKEIAPGDLSGSLLLLSRLLEKQYGQKVIILIDEYDVPLAKAFDKGYYDQMVVLIRNMLAQALKSNGSLKFAVLTGCMRISKESIFTGLNNLRVLSITDVRFDEYFGFTDEEVRVMLDYYGLSDKYDLMKEWYDGYRFGNVNVYCPWDVINYCDKLLFEPDAEPGNYWINTSSNDIVRRFIECGENTTVKREIERLVDGEAIEKTVRQELTYPELYDSVENIWSVLFTTGYLTQKEKINASRFKLVIPNQEIRSIYTSQIMEFFKENVKKDGQTLTHFCSALESGDAVEAEKCFGKYLRKTISIRDTASPKPMKENFYHGILLGILGMKDSWGVSSNRESGEGYSDILVEIGDYELAILIEVKYAEDGDMDAACERALAQIEEKHYAEELLDEGYERVLKYGIACYKKRCRVKLAKESSI